MYLCSKRLSFRGDQCSFIKQLQPLAVKFAKKEREKKQVTYLNNSSCGLVCGGCFYSTNNNPVTLQRSFAPHYYFLLYRRYNLQSQVTQTQKANLLTIAFRICRGAQQKSNSFPCFADFGMFSGNSTSVLCQISTPYQHQMQKEQ